MVVKDAMLRNGLLFISVVRPKVEKSCTPDRDPFCLRRGTRMQENREHNADNPLRNLTEAQFMALGGNAVVYVKHVKGADMGPILPGAEFDESSRFPHRGVGRWPAADGRRQRRRAWRTGWPTSRSGTVTPQ